jgi:hypothetical protein
MVKKKRLTKEPPPQQKRRPKHKSDDKPNPKRVLRAVPLGSGRPSITKMKDELEDMWDVLMGREEPPIGGPLSLMEVADAYYARAAELTSKIQESEREGFTTKGDALYHFRTGELRTFMEMAKRAADLGSRRLSEDQLQFEMERYGRESRGHR